MSKKEEDELADIHALLKSGKFKASSNLPELSDNTDAVPTLNKIIDDSIDPAKSNPFLSTSIRKQLETNRESSRKIQKEFDKLSPRNTTKNLNTANYAYLQLEKKLRIKADSVLQDIVDDFVPMIKAELRRRLTTEMNTILDPIIKQMVNERIKETDETV